MASHWFSIDLQQEVSCPICLDILQDPVTIDCGHNFCHGCITQLKETSENFLQCPICKSSMRKDTFSPNWLLGNLVERIQAINFSERWSEEEELRCPKHGEKLHYFCEEDGELLCVVCHDSKDHKSHNTRVIEEAAQHHQEQIQLHMGVLQQKKQLYSNDQDEEKISTFVAQVKFEKQRIQTEFKHLQQVLEEEKNFLLSSIEWLEKEGIKECENCSAVTQAQFSSLKDSLTSKQQMPPRQLLQDIKGTLHRNGEVQFQFHSTTPIPLDLQKQLNKVKSRHDSIIRRLKECGDQLQAVRKKYQAKFLQDMRTTLRQSGDPTAYPGCSTPHPPAQFQPQWGARFEVTESGLELSLAPGGVPRNAAEVDTAGTCTCTTPSSSVGLHRVLTPVIFDGDSAHPALSLSRDLKTVIADMIPQDCIEDPGEPQRFFPSRCVLGSPGFSTGRHSWEVERSGPRGGPCVLGVAWEQAPRQGSLTLEPGSGFWVLRFARFKCQALTGSNTWEDLPVCPRRVGVCVDLQEKEVSFYDPDTDNHIYTFQASFPGKIFPFFRLLFSGTQITLNP